MRRKIELYINGSLADLADQELVLYNYAFTDLENPTAVRNSYSKQITLPGTPANDRIFGHYYRAPKTGGFNALVKTPFTIMDEKGGILESGYLRLDSVERKGDVVTGWKVSLFGGLGSFFYALSYDAEGNKRTLADLDYLGTEDPESELDFTINATAVLDAWDRVMGAPLDVVQKWDVINFAPCYEGYPDGAFNPDKGLVTYSAVGLPDEVEDADGNTYGTKSGKLLVNMPHPVDGWAAKDLRSYLQRPVFSIWAMLKAMQNAAENGGHTFDFSAVPRRCYQRLWKTLPLIPSLTSFHEEKGTAAATRSSIAGVGPAIGTYTLSAELDTAHLTTAAINATIRLHFGGETGNALAGITTVSAGIYYVSYLFFQLVAEDSNGNVIGGSNVRVIGGTSALAPAGVAAALGYTPVFSDVDYYPLVGSVPNLFTKVADGEYNLAVPVDLSAKTQGAYRWRLYCHAYAALWNTGTGTLTAAAGGTSARAYAFRPGSVYVTPSLRADTAYIVSGTASVTYVVQAEGRTGAGLTKRMLLSGDRTPAEYLIGWAKTFGLVFRYDSALKKVEVLPRNAFFQDRVTDLSARVDRSKPVTVQPLNCGSRWFDFAPEVAPGAYAQQYAQLQGVGYGIQRVDTGYEFNADHRDLLEGYPFRGAVCKLDHGKYWNIITQGGYFQPSPFLDSGTFVTYWDPTAHDKVQEVPVYIWPTASITYYNGYGHNGYDYEFAPKIELRDADGKAVDGGDVLLWYVADNEYDKFKVSDDTALMLAINNGVPCWDLDPGSGALLIPSFCRFNDYYEENRLVRSLDFGNPREMDLPYINVDEDAPLYAKYWRAFLRDRLDRDTKVMKCKVDMRGLQPGPDLLRGFWWYDGSLWVLNKVENWSLTTWDPVECEFIQVRDKANYISGQLAT